MRIWDCHTHFSGVEGPTPEERIDRLLNYADRMQIERLVLFMGMKFVHDPSPDEMRLANDEVLRALRHRPERLFGFVYLTPNHVEASMAELERCLAGGPMVGIKLWVARRCNSPELDPILARARELQAPVLQHTYLKATGNLPGESTPMDLADLARRHPNVSIIGAHMGSDFEVGIAAVRDCTNVSMDLCGFDPVSGVTEVAVKELGAERVLFGSDAGGRSFASQLGKVLGANIPERAKQLVLGENLRRLLAPIFKRKGIKI